MRRDLVSAHLRQHLLSLVVTAALPRVVFFIVIFVVLSCFCSSPVVVGGKSLASGSWGQRTL